jgi:hypothetical protein
MLNPLDLNDLSYTHPSKARPREFPLIWHGPSTSKPARKAGRRRLLPRVRLNPAFENLRGAWEQDRRGVPLPVAIYPSSHIVTERKQLASNIVRRHTSLDPDQAPLHIRKPGTNPPASKLLSQNDRPPLIQANQVQRVLTCIDTNSPDGYRVGLL